MELFGFFNGGSILYIGYYAPWRYVLYNDKMKEFEKELNNWYPLGNDSFKIDHGKKYFEFFKRLGEVNYQICLDQNNNIIAGGCGVLRKVLINEKHNGLTKVWYLCDLKVHPDHRGKHLPLKMAKKTALTSYIKSQKGYAISMNPTGKRILKLAQNFKFIGLNFDIKSAGNLLIYSLNYDQMLQVHNELKMMWGTISYLSMNGIKDLILKSNNQPMKILHVQHGYDCEMINSLNIPIEGYIYMLCCHENDQLVNILKSYNITTEVTATIIHYNMDDSDWRFILTNDI